MIQKFLSRFKDVLIGYWGSSVILALVQFAPLLPRGGTRPLSLSFGDNRVLWLPALQNLFENLKRGNIYGVDLLTFNGASDFFSRPNIFGMNPLVLSLMALQPMKMSDSFFRFIFLYALVLTIGCLYCLQRIGTRYFGLERGYALILAVGYTSSIYIYNSLCFAPFLSALLAIPILSYAFLELYSRSASFHTVFLGTMAVVFTLTGGYVPLAVMAIAVSYGVLASHAFVYRQEKLTEFWKRAVSVHLALIVGGALCLPYYVSLVKNQAIAAPAEHSIGHIIHDLAVSPKQLAQVFSPSIVSSGWIQYEYLISLGPVLCVFLFSWLLHLGSTSSNDSEASRRRLASTFLILMALGFLLSLGRFSAVSHLFYYFVPKLGTMHIYQRFLAQFSIFFYLLLAVVVKHELENLKPRFWRALFAVGVLILFASSLFHQQRGEALISDPLAIEVLILAMMAVLIPLVGLKTRAVVVLAAVALIQWAPFFNQKFNPLFELSPEKQTEVSRNNLERIAQFFDTESSPSKKIVKVLELQPDFVWTQVPKNFSWLLRSIGTKPVSTYYGYEYHLSAERQYSIRMPTVDGSKYGGAFTFFPDQSLIDRNGADFALYHEDEMRELPERAWIRSRIDPAKVLRLGNKIAIAKLNEPLRSGKADNGYFACGDSNGLPTELKDFSTNVANRWSFGIDSASPVRCDWLFWGRPGYALYVDGKKSAFTIERGEMSFEIPAGSHRIELRYEKFISWFGNVVLLGFTVVGLGYLLACLGLRAYLKQVSQ